MDFNKREISILSELYHGHVLLKAMILKSIHKTFLVAILFGIKNKNKNHSCGHLTRFVFSVYYFNSLQF